MHRLFYEHGVTLYCHKASDIQSVLKRKMETVQPNNEIKKYMNEQEPVPVSLAESINKLVSREKLHQLNHFLENRAAWEVVPELCALLCTSRERSNLDSISTIEETLIHLSKNRDPKELLLLFIEELKGRKDDVAFRVLLKPIQTCLFRIPIKTGHSLSLVLYSLYSYISSLPLPKELNLEGKERLLLVTDKNVCRIMGIIPQFLDFLCPCVSAVEWKVTGAGIHQNRSQKQVKDLTSCLINLFSQPMVFLDLSHPTSVVKSNSRLCAERCVKFISQLHPDILQIVITVFHENEALERKIHQKSLSSMDDTDENSSLPVLGISTLTYLVFSEHLYSESVPCVYTQQFLFELLCPLVCPLLHRSETLVIHKGLSMCDALLKNLKLRTWTVDFFECPSVVELIKCVVYVAASVKTDELRQVSHELLATLLKIFEARGRLNLLQYLLMIEPPNTIIGYILSMVRNEIDEALRRNDQDFLSSSLEIFLTFVFLLPKAEQTDLLENNEKIKGTLILLEFLLSRDCPNENRTGVWNLIPNIEERYFQQLNTGLNLSRAHYELELKHLREAKHNQQKSCGALKDTQSLITFDEQTHVLEMAIETFHMQQSLLGKVAIFLEHQKQETRDTRKLIILQNE